MACGQVPASMSRGLRVAAQREVDLLAAEVPGAVRPPATGQVTDPPSLAFLLPYPA